MKRFESPEVKDYMDKVHTEFLRLKAEAEFFGSVSWNDMDEFWKVAHETIKEGNNV